MGRQRRAPLQLRAQLTAQSAQHDSARSHRSFYWAHDHKPVKRRAKREKLTLDERIRRELEAEK